MKPTIGRIVHYWPGQDSEAKSNGNDGPMPAIVTRVWSDVTVNLLIFRDADTPVVRTSVLKSEATTEPSPSWNWPERVDA